MKKHRIFCLTALLTAVSVFCGCMKKETALLEPYSDRIRLNPEIGQEQLFRADGITGGICVVGDETQFDADEIDARAAVSFNITQKETLYSKNSFEQLPMASLTKLMTALLAFKYGDLDQTVTLGDEVVITTYDAWLCGFKPGDQVAMRDLLKAALVYSGNDAANGIAVAVGGSLDAFVEMMNQEAAALGATGTQFKNPNGLDANGHYSTAYDIYLIFNECLKYPEFRQIIPLESFSCAYTTASGEDVVKVFSSGNGYLAHTAVPPDGVTVFGGKTGHTEKALECLATLAAKENGDEYVVIVLGAETKQQVYAQTNVLLYKIP